MPATMVTGEVSPFRHGAAKRNRSPIERPIGVNVVQSNPPCEFVQPSSAACRVYAFGRSRAGPTSKTAPIRPDHRVRLSQNPAENRATACKQEWATHLDALGLSGRHRWRDLPSIAPQDSEGAIERQDNSSCIQLIRLPASAVTVRRLLLAKDSSASRTTADLLDRRDRARSFTLAGKPPLPP